MIFDIKVVYMSIAILIFMASNIILGSIDAIFDDAFDKKKFFRGLKKAGIVIVVMASMYGAGILNPDVIAININDQKMNVVTAVNALLLSAFVFYFKLAYDKLKLILTKDYSKFDKTE